jgi:hypothetical protein
MNFCPTCPVRYGPLLPTPTTTTQTSQRRLDGFQSFLFFLASILKTFVNSNARLVHVKSKLYLSTSPSTKHLRIGALF